MTDVDVPVAWSTAPGRIALIPAWIMAPPSPDEEAPEVVAPPREPSSPPPAAAAAPESAPEAEPVHLVAPPSPVETPAKPDETAALRAALLEAITSGARTRRSALDAAERDLVHLAMTIARQVIARELATDPALIAAWAREGINALADQDQVVIAIAPDVAELVPTDAWSSALGVVAGPIVDRSLPRSGCEVRGRYGRVDAGVEARLASVMDALGAAPAATAQGEPR